MNKSGKTQKEKTTDGRNAIIYGTNNEEGKYQGELGQKNKVGQMWGGGGGELFFKL